MKQILEALYSFTTLSEAEAYAAMQQVAGGYCNEAQLAGFLSAYIMRKPAPGELSGFCAALMDNCRPVLLHAGAADIVGTGGDGKDSFNISTLSAIVVAAAGYKVIKHGNYGASSFCGSSNILEYLGYSFSRDETVLQRQLDKTNFCFLHAPLFHPALKNVALTRKNLGVRTFFNLLGPLVNPARPEKQLLGVSNLEIARTYNYLLQGKGQQYAIVYSLDGYDEISLTAPFKVMSATGEELYEPIDIGFDYIPPKAIAGGNSMTSAAAIFKSVLTGDAPQDQIDVVIVNSGFAIRLFHPEKPVTECAEIARAALLSGKALEVFKQVINS